MMTTCKDCLHSEVCAYIKPDLPICSDFADRSKYVVREKGEWEDTSCSRCGWCSKWDKKCDKKIPGSEQRVKCDPIDDVTITNKVCQSESDHEWECTGMSTVGTTYICRKCHARKTVPYESAVEDIPTWLSGKSNRL